MEEGRRDEALGLFGLAWFSLGAGARDHGRRVEVVLYARLRDTEKQTDRQRER